MKDYPYLRRLAAFFVDWYFSAMICAVPTFVFQSLAAGDLVLDNRIDNLPLGYAVGAAIGGVALFFAYFSLLPLRMKGQTPGRRLARLALVDKGGQAAGLGQFLLHDVVGLLLLQGSLTNVNVYLMVLLQRFTGWDILARYQAIYLVLIGASVVLVFTKRRQTLPDLISGTKVILLEQQAK